MGKHDQGIAYYIWSATGADDDTVEALHDLAMHFHYVTPWSKDATARHVVNAWKAMGDATDGVWDYLDFVYPYSAKCNLTPDALIMMRLGLEAITNGQE